ncbi:flagellar biosynthetic protein FliR [Candidatus Margulisiibacteriota bacterium]
MIITYTEVLVFFLIVARIMGLMLYAPIFANKSIFSLSKLPLVLWCPMLIIFSVPLATKLPETGVAYALAVFLEILLGAIIGFATDLLITGIEMAGTLMDTQAGLSVAALLDPSTGRQITIFSHMLKWVAVMIFFLMDGHHIVLSAFFQSYKVLPVGAPFNLSEGALYIVKQGTYLFYLAVQLASPILLVVFLVDFGFGMLNKVAQQVNVFQLGFQLKPSVSLIIFFAIIPGLSDNILRILRQVTDIIMRLLFTFQINYG